MIKLSAGKKAGAVFVLCALTAIAAQAQTFTSLFSFNGHDGFEPAFGSLIQGPDGAFYGTTLEGGANDVGTAFRMTSEGTLKTVNLTLADGVGPQAGLLLATNGHFYGTAQDGGANTNGCFERSCGTVFEITPTGTLTVLYSFCAQTGCTDGYYPFGALIQAANGDFYGTTSYGGSGRYIGNPGNGGTVFKITASGELTTLYSFCSQSKCDDGSEPYAALVQGTDGNFYGTTASGGHRCAQDTDCGTVFRITPRGVLTTLHRFQGADGSGPFAGLIQATDGDLYGTTFDGGDLTCDPPYGCGTIFKINPAGVLTTLHSFEATDGIGPAAPLVQATDGNFYGTTTGTKNTGSFSNGTVFYDLPPRCYDNPAQLRWYRWCLPIRWAPSSHGG